MDKRKRYTKREQSIKGHLIWIQNIYYFTKGYYIQNDLHELSKQKLIQLLREDDSMEYNSKDIEKGLKTLENNGWIYTVDNKIRITELSVK